MKRLITAAMTLSLCFALLAPAAAQPENARRAIATNNLIVVSNSTDLPDAHAVHPAVYKIDGANYFRLRDVAMLLNGSAKQFSVVYDDETKSVSIVPGEPYSPTGTELSGSAAETADAIVTNNTIRIGGEEVSLTVFKIDGSNYFKLRDLGRALDFRVSYDDETKAVTISGARSYEEDALPAVRYVRTNGYHEDVRYPVLTLIGSVEELEQYVEENRDSYDLSHRETVYADSTAGFADAIEAYDEPWFETHQLLLVLLEEGSGSIRHEVTAVTAGAEPAVDIDRLVPECCTDDMAEWHILIELEKGTFDSADGIAVRFTSKNME